MKLEEERDTIGSKTKCCRNSDSNQDKYCRNSDSNSLRWQNVSKSNTTDSDITNNLVQMPNISDIHVRNRYELLIDERDYNSSNELGNNH